MEIKKEQIVIKDKIFQRRERKCWIQRRYCKDRGISYACFDKNNIDRKFWQIAHVKIDLECPSIIKNPEVSDDTYDVLLPLKKLATQIGTKKYELNNNQYIVVNPGLFRSFSELPDKKETECLDIVITYEFWKKLFTKLNWKNTNQIIEFEVEQKTKPLIFKNTELHLITEMSKLIREVNILFMEETIEKILIKLIENHPWTIHEDTEEFKIDPRLRKALEFIKGNYSKKDITIDSISANSGVSRRHLVRLFKERIGKSPSEYLILHRIEQACRMILDPSISISQITEMVGYDNESSLRKAFAIHMKKPPSAFRPIKG